MQIDLNKIKAHCQAKGATLSKVLQNAGVSRNAFYSLARKESVVPKSILEIADQIGVSVSEILSEAPSPAERMKEIAEEASRIVSENPEADWDNVRHSLILLDEKPIERLRRSLRRGRQLDIR